jgi:hypothetical protein
MSQPDWKTDLKQSLLALTPEERARFRTALNIVDEVLVLKCHLASDDVVMAMEVVDDIDGPAPWRGQGA